MNGFLPYGHQWVSEDDIKAVNEVMRSDWLTQGPKGQEFEEKLADYFGASYAVTFSSGTTALHAAYFAAGLKKGKSVITTPITFVATANAALFLEAEVDFVDIEAETANINASLIEEKIKDKTKAIAVVDFAGQPVDLDEIRGLAKKHGLFVIEDACHAIGSAYKERRIGGLSDLTVFSFHPVKNITTGEGGAVLTNNLDFYEKLILFRHHGIVREPEKVRDVPGTWYYEMCYLGNNYRLTDMQCALGLSQLNKLDFFVSRRREIAEHYNQAFQDMVEIRPLKEKNDRLSAWHIYVIKLNLEKLGKTRREVFDELRNQRIGVQVHYIPVYWHPYYQQVGFKKGICPTAEWYYERALTLPLFPAMKDEDVERVIEAVKKAVRRT